MECRQASIDADKQVQIDLNPIEKEEETTDPDEDQNSDETTTEENTEENQNSSEAEQTVYQVYVNVPEANGTVSLRTEDGDVAGSSAAVKAGGCYRHFSLPVLTPTFFPANNQ